MVIARICHRRGRSKAFGFGSTRQQGKTTTPDSSGVPALLGSQLIKCAFSCLAPRVLCVDNMICGSGSFLAKHF